MVFIFVTLLVALLGAIYFVKTKGKITGIIYVIYSAIVITIYLLFVLKVL